MGAVTLDQLRTLGGRWIRYADTLEAGSKKHAKTDPQSAAHMLVAARAMQTAAIELMELIESQEGKSIKKSKS